MKLLGAWTGACLLAALWIGCSGGSAPPADGGVDADGGGDGGDTGPALNWPAAEAQVDGVQPALGISAAGTLILAHVADGQVWLTLDPASGAAPVAVGDQVGETTWLRAAGSPSEDLVLLTWSYTRAVWVDASGPRSPADRLIDSFDLGARLQTAWTGQQAILLTQDTEGLHALAVGPPGAPKAAAPTADDLILGPRPGASYFNEMPLAVDLGADRVLVFATDGEANDSGYGSEARWVVARRDQNSGAYFRPLDSGTLTMPGPEDKNRAWIQAHDLGPDGLVLSWAEVADGSQVFDLYLARLQVDQGGRPTFASTAINLSNTPGQTDNSDHPLVRATGDGRLWVAWRERNFGPRVALLDADLSRLALTAPDDELRLDDSQPISAVVDAAGNLHLAAVVWPDDAPQIHCWRFDLPR